MIRLLIVVSLLLLNNMEIYLVHGLNEAGDDYVKMAFVDKAKAYEMAKKTAEETKRFSYRFDEFAVETIKLVQ